MKIFTVVLLCIAALPAQASETAITQVQDSYRTEEGSAFAATRGKSMWTQSFIQKKSGKQVSCATCHTADLKRAGSHIRTGKTIGPMATTANEERFNDPAKIEKWFLRNCKWTLGRECTAQEKGDFLSYFQSE